MAIALAMVATVAGIVWVRRPLSLEDAAAKLAACVKSEDVSCVQDYIDSNDRSAYSLDAAKIRWLLGELHRSMHPGAGGITIARQPNVSIVVAQVPYISTQNEKHFNLGLTVSDTEEGIKAPLFVTGLLLTMAYADSSATQPNAVTKLDSWANFARDKGERWAEEGFPGIYRDPAEGMISWTDWETNCRQRLARAKAATLARQGTTP